MGDRGDLARLDIRVLRPEERRLAAGLTARAMRDNPTTEAMFGCDPLERLARMQLLWTAFFRSPPPTTRAVFYRGCLLGVASAAAPGRCIGHTFGVDPAETAGRAEPPPGDPARQNHVLATYAVHDLPEPHWHIGPVAIEPGFQGRGIGNALMRELVGAMDGDGCASWFETDTESNVRFYGALGWETVKTVEVMGVPLWFMRRPGAPAPASEARRTDPALAPPAR
jgi:ribosomal protein S18 acetylase RimI-like enzyme